jgi:hypothetical protein
VTEILIVANETLGGVRLREVLLSRQKVFGTFNVRLVVPQARPRRGSVIYVDAVHGAAQVRLDLALAVFEEEGIEATGEVGDSDPFVATMDAIGDRMPDEIIISTLPASSSGWLRRDLIDRVAEASGIGVTHVMTDVDEDGLSFDTSLVVANQTADSAELAAHLKSLKSSGGEHLFIVVVPQAGRDGRAADDARARLTVVLERLRTAGLLTAGMIGDPDPFTATMNALQFFRVNRVIISTLPETKSGWMRADLVERVRRYALCPVEHVVAADTDTVAVN